MSNSITLQLYVTSNLNKLYSYSNLNLHYVLYNKSMFILPYFLQTHMSGLYTSFCLLNNVSFLKMSPLFLTNKLPPFLFANQRRKSLNSIIKSPLLNSMYSISTKSSTPSNSSVRINSYTMHQYFTLYQTYFNSLTVPLFSPFIKKKPRTFPFVSKMFTTKVLKFQRLKKRIFSHRKLWFLYTLFKLNKSFKLTNFSKETSLRRFMKTLRLKRDQNGKRKNYLTPRQHLFLNGSRLTLKGKKPIKTTLLRRISRFYRRKLRRMDISYFNPTLTVKNLKYKSSLLTLKKRSSQFTLKTLSDIKFNNIRFNMFKIIRRGKSRLKLRRTKKYYSYFNRILNINLISYLFTTILKHYRFSRVRYLNRFFRHHARRYKINTFGLFFRTLPSIPLFNSRNHLYDITITPSVLQEYFGSSYETFSTYPSNLEKLIQTKFENLFTTRSKLSMLSPIYRLFKRDNDFNRHTVISSKYKTPFILSTIGFVFIQTIYTKNSSYVKSALNRFRYSFFFKKDLKRYLLKKPGKLKLLTSSLLFTNYKIRDERPSIALLHSDWSNKFIGSMPSSSTPLSNNLLTAQNPFFSYKHCRKYDNHLGTFFNKEVRIKRIKFKPGYSRIWRSARESINTALNLNARYQYRLTRHLHRIKHLAKQTQAFIYDLTLKNTLLNSHFVTDHNSALLMISNGLVFVNGIQVSNSNLNLFQNDFVQIIVSLKYYIIFRWLMNWNSAKRIRLRKLSKTKFKKFKMMANKQRSRNLPDWILTSRLKSFDIPKYLEIDFFTLSSFIIYEPFVSNDLNSLNFLESRSEIINMYNWKYIN